MKTENWSLNNENQTDFFERNSSLKKGNERTREKKCSDLANKSRYSNDWLMGLLKDANMSNL